MRLLVATTNPGKIREIRQVLDGLPLELVTLADLPAIAEPDETGLTFAANARDKALAYWRAARIPTVAEDSGLAIDALGGRPGVESARYPGRTYPEKFTRLYRELAPHPRPWTARFVCALAFIEADLAPAASATTPSSSTRPTAPRWPKWTPTASLPSPTAAARSGSSGRGSALTAGPDRSA